jgi:hypothetical protein
MNWPRAPLLVTMSLYNLKIRRRERTARWQFCFLPRLTNLSNSGCTCKQRNWCRNLSAPLFFVLASVYARGEANIPRYPRRMTSVLRCAALAIRASEVMRGVWDL